jgi:hypothetical protein
MCVFHLIFVGGTLNRQAQTAGQLIQAASGVQLIGILFVGLSRGCWFRE